LIAPPPKSLQTLLWHICPARHRDKALHFGRRNKNRFDDPRGRYGTLYVGLLIVRSRFAAVVLFFIGGACAAASQPSQQNATSQQHPQASAATQSAYRDNRGTKDAPLVVEIKAVPERTQEERDEQAADRHDKADTDRWMVRLTAILAVATALLVVATGFLWCATQRLVRGAEDTAKRQLRAYVWHEIGGGPTHTEDSIAVNFQLRNSGATPAYKTHAWTKIQLIDDTAVASYEFEEAPKEIEAPRFAIHPNSVHTQGGRIKVNPGEKKDFLFGTKILHIWGEIRYVDAFGDAWWSKFRLYWRYVAEDRAIWAYSDDGNEET
jgi:hypothetical protein